jgi:hypothetical protein
MLMTGVYLVSLKDQLPLVRLVSSQQRANSSPGAFVAAPLGGLLFALAAFVLRLAFLWIIAKVRGCRFDALDRPVFAQSTLENERSDGYGSEDHEETVQGTSQIKGKFF